MAVSLPEDLKTAADRGGPTQAYFHFSGQCCRSVVARVVESGAIVCIPRLGLDISHFTHAEEEGYPGILGPYMEGNVDPVSTRAVRRKLDVILFDLDASGFDCIVTELPGDVLIEQVTSFGSYRGSLDWPAPASLLALVDIFLQAGQDERLEAYLSCAEVPNGEGQPGDETQRQASPADQLLQQLLTQAEVTQRAVQGIQGQVALVGELGKRLDRLEAGVPAVQDVGPRHPQLFNRSPGLLPAATQQRLRELAGGGPGRLGDLRGAGRPNAAADGGAPLGGMLEAAEEEEDLDLAEGGDNPTTLSTSA